MKELGISLLSLGITGILTMLGVICFMMNALMGIIYLFVISSLIGAMLIYIGED